MAQKDTKLQQNPEQEQSTRRRILDVARSEFARYGKAGARVDRIASEAGINKAMIYYYYQSKENLYQAVITDFYNDITATVKERALPASTLEDVLLGLAGAWASMFERIVDFRPIMLRELAQPEGDTLETVARIFRDTGIIPKVSGLMQQAAKEGKLRLLDPQQTMVSFVTMNIGYFMLQGMLDRVLTINNPHEFIEQRRKAVVDLFLNGVLAR